MILAYLLFISLTLMAFFNAVRENMVIQQKGTFMTKKELTPVLYIYKQGNCYLVSPDLEETKIALDVAELFVTNYVIRLVIEHGLDLKIDVVQLNNWLMDNMFMTENTWGRYYPIF